MSARVAIAILGASLVAACGDDSNAPSGRGDHVIPDVDATNQPPQGQFDGGPDSPFEPPTEDAGYGAVGDASAYAACVACGCEGGTYCFGGGRSYPVPTAACPASAGAPSPGCAPLPAACTSTPTCACLIGALASTVACYTACETKPGLIVYCP